LTHTVVVHILDDSLMTLYATILISVMALCYADTIDLSAVVIGTRCSFYLRLLTFVMMFLVYSFPMVLPSHSRSSTLLYCF